MAVNLNPMSSLTNMLSSGVNAAGGLAQGANSLAANANMQSALFQGTGSSQSVAAQQQASQQADANQAKLIGLQEQETERKQTMDVLNAIASGKADSANKEISATAQNAKGISF
jgi:hypothetical protein